MSTTVALIGGCAVVTFAIKAAVPVALGGRELPRWFMGIVVLLAPALLTALVVTQALAHGHHVQVGAQTAGVAAGGSRRVAVRLDRGLRGGRRRGDSGPARALVGA